MGICCRAGSERVGWERGRYYTRSVRRGGRVVRVYVGGGDVGEAACAADEARREEAAREQTARVAGEAAARVMDAAGMAVAEELRVSVEGLLGEMGFWRPGRGAWRRRRGGC